MKEKVMYLIIAFLIGVAAYTNGLKIPFMLDDYAFLSQFQSKSLLSHFIPGPGDVYYRPLAHLVPHLSYLAFKQNPAGYHIVNLLLLIAASCALRLLLRCLLPPWPAMAASLLFLLHPINGIMVNYITASVFSVQVISACLCLWAIVRKASRREMALICFILALICHETSVMIPSYAVIAGMIMGDGFVAALRRSAVLWGALIVYLIFRIYQVPWAHYDLSVAQVSWGEGLSAIARLLSWYAQKLFIPVDIFLMWSVPFTSAKMLFWIALSVTAVLGLGIILRYAWYKQRQLALLVIWFLIGLIPLGIGAMATPYLGALIEPHWFVVGSIGFFGCMAMGITIICDKQKVIVLVVLVLALFACVRVNNALWSNEIKLYETWSLQNPEFKGVHYFLGIAYKRQGRSVQAREHLSKAIAGRQKDWVVYLNLAQLDLMEGNLEQARKNMALAKRLEPRHTDILNTLGAMAYSQRQWKEAEKFFKEAIAADPYNLEPRINLALTYANAGRTTEAIALCRDILKVAPGFDKAENLLQQLESTHS